MDVSVIIPTYKRSEKLEKLILSLTCQETVYEYEIIVIDNGNDEQTRSICEKFRINYIKLGSNIGPAKARDIGAKFASGKILAFVDDDEIVDKNWIQVIVNNISKDNPVIYGPIRANIKPFYPFIHSFDRGEYILPSGNFAILKEIFQKIDGFEGTISYFGEDWFLNEKLRKINLKPRFVKDMVVYHPAVFKKWLYKNYLKDIFLNYVYSYILKKEIKIYPLEKFYNELFIKNFFLFLSCFILYFFFKLKGILFFYILSIIYFSFKSFLIYNILCKNKLKVLKNQMILYSFFGVFNPIIQFIILNISFYFFILFYDFFNKNSKRSK